MPYFKNKHGANLYYAADGGGAPPIVFLHPLPFDHRIWVHQTFEFSFHHRILALDFPGLGCSDPPPSSTSTISSLAEDVKDMMQAEGVDQAAIIVGLSIGGAVAQQFILRYPEKVRALVLSGTSSSYRAEEVRSKFSDRVQGYQSPDARAYYARNLELLFSPRFAASPQGRNLLELYATAKVDFPSVSRHFAALLECDLEEEIQSIKVPTLVIAGDEDRAFFDSKRIAEKIPRAKFVPIGGAGHVVCYEQPQLFNAAMRDFLKHSNLGSD